MKRLVLPPVLAAVLLASVLGTSQARADNPNAFQVKLTCDNSQSYQVLLLPGDALQLIDSTSNFRIAIWFYTDASGFQHFLINSKADPQEQLVTCHYTGPVSGNHYTTIGFFTPVG